MATESPVKMLSNLGMGGTLNDNLRAPVSSRQDSYYEGIAKELGLLLKDRTCLDANDMEKDMLYRSGSAPPSVEGSLAAMGGLFNLKDSVSTNYSFADSNEYDILEGEQRLRSDPAYLSYYYSHVNLNPRLPPPLVSRENWRLAQRLDAIREKSRQRSVDGSINSSLFSSKHVLATTHEESETLGDNDKTSSSHTLSDSKSSSEWAEGTADGLIGISPIGLGSHRKSFVDLIQEEFPRTQSPAFQQSRPSSRVAHGDGESCAAILDAQLSRLRQSTTTPVPNSAELQATSSLGPRSATPKPVPLPHGSSPNALFDTHMSLRQPVSPSLGETLGLLDKPNIERPLSRNTSVGGVSMTGTSDFVNAINTLNLADVRGASSFDERKLQQDPRERQDSLLHLHKAHQQLQQLQTPQSLIDAKSSSHSHALQQVHHQQLQAQVAALQPTFQNSAMNQNIYAAAAAAAMSYISGGNPYSQNSNMGGSFSPQYGLGGYPLNNNLVPSMLMGYPPPGALPGTLDSAAMAAAVAATLEARATGTGLAGGMGMDMQQLYRFGAQPGASQQFPAYDPLYFQYCQRIAQDARLLSALNDHSALNGYMNGLYADLLTSQKTHGGLSGIGSGLSYTGNPLTSPIISSSAGISTSPLRQNERNSRHSVVGSRLGAGIMNSWQPDHTGESVEDSHLTLLDEFKSSKTRCFELPDIMGQVVEFSVDQHGSRFIQQKLEVAKPEEKAIIFEEILPRSLTLMTDVFGNYVIQKFFEHGTLQQRKDLGNQLTGHVLSLSLQMYGCRVIQKAIEVVDVDQQTQLVSELDGQVMRCVRDQNGNHVIQKCIECVPQEKIQFIISTFFGQVVTLSTHPYGCRVIQRVLEHCNDARTQHHVMEEILHSTCTLAQDQYGNYVVQHVLEHGKPNERSEVIKRLAGHIVQMSQHKFASNVVEKCLEFGGPVERQVLINEILGDTDENEPLQAMMKDQFANYVVQKVLEICDDKQREILLARIKIHLHGLKKYTYGKHIVARVEKLVVAGERRSAISRKAAYDTCNSPPETR